MSRRQLLKTLLFVLGMAISSLAFLIDKAPLLPRVLSFISSDAAHVTEALQMLDRGEATVLPRDHPGAAVLLKWWHPKPPPQLISHLSGIGRSTLITNMLTGKHPTASQVASLSGVAIPQPKRTRWLNSPLKREELQGKRVFAHFVTASGHGYEGAGEIRARQDPDGLLAIDLVFTRKDTAYQFTDILFHLSSRQLPHLKKAPTDSDFDFEYEGILTPDIEPDDMLDYATRRF